jgi:predicted DNA-binding transcriptional regulator AlpA
MDWTTAAGRILLNTEQTGQEKGPAFLERVMKMDELLNVDQLAKLLHKSPHSVRHDATRNPRALPPICRIPGARRLLWLSSDVESWLRKHVVVELYRDNSELETSTYQLGADAIRFATRKVGRPTKAEQIARRAKL